MQATPNSDSTESNAESYSQTVCIQKLLDQLQAGDENARAELIQCACTKMEQLTRRMLRSWERVHRWEDTCDVLQNSLMRLYRSLGEAKPAKTVDFFRLAALNIRRELRDLAKHYYGPRGEGFNHVTLSWDPKTGEEQEPRLLQKTDDHGEDPANLAAWAEFHEQVERLPDEEREMFDLLWYQELSQAEVAALLGISERTVRRRWVSARLKLSEVLGDLLPDIDAPSLV
jgi:RNA polymerase sigma-70 factor (ECF subfamily)